MPKRAESSRMSPLARLLLQRRADGLTYGEMSRRATRRGLDLSVSRISQIAKDESKTRLTPAAIRALAVAVDEPPARIAVLDDQRWGVADDESTLRQRIQASSLTAAKKKELLAELDSSPERVKEGA